MGEGGREGKWGEGGREGKWGESGWGRVEGREGNLGRVVWEGGG